MNRWLMIFAILTAALVSAVHAGEPAGPASVWGHRSSAGSFGGAVLAPITLEKTPAMENLVISKGARVSGFTKAPAERHWGNVPKQAWLILILALGLLGVTVYLKIRPPRANHLNPFLVIGPPED